MGEGGSPASWFPAGAMLRSTTACDERVWAGPESEKPSIPGAVPQEKPQER